MKFEFHPQSVPSYSAVENLNVILKSYPDFSYKEATLNPTNLRDKASDWEVDVIQTLRNKTDMKEFVGERDTATGHSLYIARPLQIKDPVCLGCHTTAAEAPKTMVDIYGPNNGFGWKLNEVIGAQIVSVPMNLPIRNANHAFVTFMSSLTVVFAVLFVILNMMLSALIVQPITQLSRAADQISKGRLDAAAFPEGGKDEVSQLGQAFNRMRRSLEKAIALIDK